MKVSFHDALAGAVCLVLLVGVLALWGLGREIPEFLTGGFGAVIGYALRGSVQVANEYRHRNTPV